MNWLTNPEIWIALITLTVLEIVLGIDNIIFISIIVGKLPQEQQVKARQTGLMLALASDYGAYNADRLMAAAMEKGLAALGEELRAIEAGDAVGDKFPRFKKSDDATGLLLKLS